MQSLLLVGSMESLAATDDRSARAHELAIEALDALPAGIAVVDASGTIVALNDTWRRWAEANGLPDPRYGLGENYLEVCRSAKGPFAASAKEAGRGLETLLDGRADAFDLEYPCPTPSRTLWYRLQARRTAGDAPLRVVISHLEITERREHEDEVRRSRDEAVAAASRLAAANRELEAFNHMVSHDLRAPLRAIEVLCERVVEERADDEEIPPRALALVERIRAEAGRTRATVADLLQLASPIEMPLREEPVDIGRLAREVFRRHEREEPDRTVRLRVQPDLVVLGDPALLAVVMENLVDNAWKFTAARDEAVIEIGRIPSGHAVPVYYVRDNGIGFDPARVGELFTPFARIAPDAAYKGTGLGLASVHRIVRRHGGAIWAAAKPGEGATFFFTLRDPDAG